MPKITKGGGPSDARAEGQVRTGAGLESADLDESNGDAEPELAEEGLDDGALRAEYEALTVDQLRDELISRHLVTSGNKAMLVSRLVENDREEDEPPL